MRNVGYNAQLVRRGEFYLDLECVKNWHRELKQMNRKKSGAPYKYPESFILFASIIYSFFRMPYRQLEGFIDKLGMFVPGLISADYTTLHRRISKSALQIPIPEDDVVVAVASGHKQRRMDAREAWKGTQRLVKSPCGG